MLTHYLTQEAFTHHQGGRLEQAEVLYRKAIEEDSENLQALQLLGTLALRGHRYGEALDLFERTLVILKRQDKEITGYAGLYNNLGLTLNALGRFEEAIEWFKKGLCLDPSLKELHTALGRTLIARGNYSAAADSYEDALSIDPNMPDCLCDLGTSYAKSGRLDDAIAQYRRAVAIEPLHRVARTNLAKVLRRTRRYDEAEGLLHKLLCESPDNIRFHRHLGLIYSGTGRFALALEQFQRVLMANPDDAKTLQYIADVQKTLGDFKNARRNYLRSHELRPLITIEAIKSPPDFRVLLLFSPYAGNTPIDCLIDNVAYENNIIHLLPEARYDIEMLSDRADVVVNLISDVDLGQIMLEQAAKLIHCIGKPAVNYPHKIMRTDRESMAHILSGLPDCCIPKTRRYQKADLEAMLCDPNFDVSNLSFSFPVLVRPAGTHGGMNFEKINDDGELQDYILQHTATNLYLIDYIDYRSVDGYFRKYRFIFVNDEILPYHLAIDDKWKIHHATTDMASHEWMQQEEARFLENPHDVFSSRQFQVLGAIREKVDLDYFGIDCALDREGRIVVFEVNASMLVHHHNEQFPYKNAAVDRIKSALYGMLNRMAATQQ